MKRQSFSSPEHSSAPGRRRGRGNDSESSPFSIPRTERQQLAYLLSLTANEGKTETNDSIDEPSSETKRVKKSKQSTVSLINRPKNKSGETQLHLCATKGDLEMIKNLLRQGADVNCKDNAGWTPLHEACNHGHYKVAKFLLRGGAEVNVEGLDGDTPLHDASSNGHLEIVLLLLRHGADPHIKNDFGQSPIDVADSDKVLKAQKNFTKDMLTDLKPLKDLTPEKIKNKVVVAPPVCKFKRFSNISDFLDTEDEDDESKHKGTKTLSLKNEKKKSFNRDKPSKAHKISTSKSDDVKSSKTANISSSCSKLTEINFLNDDLSNVSLPYKQKSSLSGSSGISVEHDGYKKNKQYKLSASGTTKECKHSISEKIDEQKRDKYGTSDISDNLKKREQSGDCRRRKDSINDFGSGRKHIKEKIRGTGIDQKQPKHCKNDICDDRKQRKRVISDDSDDCRQAKNIRDVSDDGRQNKEEVFGTTHKQHINSLSEIIDKQKNKLNDSEVNESSTSSEKRLKPLKKGDEVRSKSVGKISKDKMHNKLRTDAILHVEEGKKDPIVILNKHKNLIRLKGFLDESDESDVDESKTQKTKIQIKEKQFKSEQKTNRNSFEIKSNEDSEMAHSDICDLKHYKKDTEKLRVKKHKYHKFLTHGGKSDKSFLKGKLSDISEVLHDSKNHTGVLKSHHILVKSTTDSTNEVGLVAKLNPCNEIKKKVQDSNFIECKNDELIKPQNEKQYNSSVFKHKHMSDHTQSGISSGFKHKQISDLTQSGISSDFKHKQLSDHTQSSNSSDFKDKQTSEHTQSGNSSDFKHKQTSDHTQSGEKKHKFHSEILTNNTDLLKVKQQELLESQQNEMQDMLTEGLLNSECAAKKLSDNDKLHDHTKKKNYQNSSRKISSELKSKIVHHDKDCSLDKGTVSSHEFDIKEDVKMKAASSGNIEVKIENKNEKEKKKHKHEEVKHLLKESELSSSLLKHRHEEQKNLKKVSSESSKILKSGQGDSKSKEIEVSKSLLKNDAVKRPVKECDFSKALSKHKQIPKHFDISVSMGKQKYEERNSSQKESDISKSQKKQIEESVKKETETSKARLKHKQNEVKYLSKQCSDSSKPFLQKHKNADIKILPKENKLLQKQKHQEIKVTKDFDPLKPMSKLKSVELNESANKFDTTRPMLKHKHSDITNFSKESELLPLIKQKQKELTNKETLKVIIKKADEIEHLQQQSEFSLLAEKHKQESVRQLDLSKAIDSLKPTEAKILPKDLDSLKVKQKQDDSKNLLKQHEPSNQILKAQEFNHVNKESELKDRPEEDNNFLNDMSKPLHNYQESSFKAELPRSSLKRKHEEEPNQQNKFTDSSRRLFKNKQEEVKKLLRGYDVKNIKRKHSEVKNLPKESDLSKAMFNPIKVHKTKVKKINNDLPKDKLKHKLQSQKDLLEKSGFVNQVEEQKEVINLYCKDTIQSQAEIQIKANQESIDNLSISLETMEQEKLHLVDKKFSEMSGNKILKKEIFPTVSEIIVSSSKDTYHETSDVDSNKSLLVKKEMCKQDENFDLPQPIKKVVVHEHILECGPKPDKPRHKLNYSEYKKLKRKHSLDTKPPEKVVSVIMHDMEKFSVTKINSEEELKPFAAKNLKHLKSDKLNSKDLMYIKQVPDSVSNVNAARSQVDIFQSSQKAQLKVDEDFAICKSYPIKSSSSSKFFDDSSFCHFQELNSKDILDVPIEVQVETDSQQDSVDKHIKLKTESSEIYEQTLCSKNKLKSLELVISSPSKKICDESKSNSSKSFTETELACTKPSTTKKSSMNVEELKNISIEPLVNESVFELNNIEKFSYETFTEVKTVEQHVTKDILSYSKKKTVINKPGNKSSAEIIIKEEQIDDEIKDCSVEISSLKSNSFVAMKNENESESKKFNIDHDFVASVTDHYLSDSLQNSSQQIKNSGKQGKLIQSDKELKSKLMHKDKNEELTHLQDVKTMPKMTSCSTKSNEIKVKEFDLNIGMDAQALEEKEQAKRRKRKKMLESKQKELKVLKQKSIIKPLLHGKSVNQTMDQNKSEAKNFNDNTILPMTNKQSNIGKLLLPEKSIQINQSTVLFDKPQGNIKIETSLLMSAKNSDGKSLLLEKDMQIDELTNQTPKSQINVAQPVYQQKTSHLNDMQSTDRHKKSHLNKIPSTIQGNSSKLNIAQLIHQDNKSQSSVTILPDQHTKYPSDDEPLPDQNTKSQLDMSQSTIKNKKSKLRIQSKDQSTKPPLNTKQFADHIVKSKFMKITDIDTMPQLNVAKSIDQSGKSLLSVTQTADQSSRPQLNIHMDLTTSTVGSLQQLNVKPLQLFEKSAKIEQSIHPNNIPQIQVDVKLDQSENPIELVQQNIQSHLQTSAKTDQFEKPKNIIRHLTINSEKQLNKLHGTEIKGSDDKFTVGEEHTTVSNKVILPSYSYVNTASVLEMTNKTTVPQSGIEETSNLPVYSSVNLDTEKSAIDETGDLPIYSSVNLDTEKSGIEETGNLPIYSSVNLDTEKSGIEETGNLPIYSSVELDTEKALTNEKIAVTETMVATISTGTTENILTANSQMSNVIESKMGTNLISGEILSSDNVNNKSSICILSSIENKNFSSVESSVMKTHFPLSINICEKDSDAILKTQIKKFIHSSTDTDTVQSKDVIDKVKLNPIPLEDSKNLSCIGNVTKAKDSQSTRSSPTVAKDILLENEDAVSNLLSIDASDSIYDQKKSSFTAEQSIFTNTDHTFQGSHNLQDYQISSPPLDSKKFEAIFPSVSNQDASIINSFSSSTVTTLSLPIPLSKDKQIDNVPANVKQKVLPPTTASISINNDSISDKYSHLNINTEMMSKHFSHLISPHNFSSTSELVSPSTLHPEDEHLDQRFKDLDEIDEKALLLAGKDNVDMLRVSTNHPFKKDRESALPPSSICLSPDEIIGKVADCILEMDNSHNVNYDHQYAPTSLVDERNYMPTTSANHHQYVPTTSIVDQLYIPKTSSEAYRFPIGANSSPSVLLTSDILPVSTQLQPANDKTVELLAKTMQSFCQISTQQSVLSSRNAFGNVFAPQLNVENNSLMSSQMISSDILQPLTVITVPNRISCDEKMYSPKHISDGEKLYSPRITTSTSFLHAESRKVDLEPCDIVRSIINSDLPALLEDDAQIKSEKRKTSETSITPVSEVIKVLCDDVGKSEDKEPKTQVISRTWRQVYANRCAPVQKLNIKNEKSSQVFDVVSDTLTFEEIQCKADGNKLLLTILLKHASELEKLRLSMAQEIGRVECNCHLQNSEKGPISVATILYFQNDHKTNSLNTTLSFGQKCKPDIEKLLHARLDALKDKYEGIKKTMLYRHKLEIDSFTQMEKLKTKCSYKEILRKRFLRCHGKAY